MGSPFLSAVLLAWAGQCLLGEPVRIEEVAPIATFALRISVAVDPDPPGLDPGWLGTEIDTAEALFAPFGVHFAGMKTRAASARSTHVETRADRDAFATDVAPHVVNVFVVDSLRDVDDPGEVRRGVHWHGPGGAHYIILVSTAGPAVLAHELGHFFGNPHSKVVDNLMSYERSGGGVFFDETQGRRIVLRARDYLASGELTAVTRPR